MSFNTMKNPCSVVNPLFESFQRSRLFHPSNDVIHTFEKQLLDFRFFVKKTSNNLPVSNDMQSRRHGGALVGLAPPNKASSPPKLKFETL